MLASEEGFVRLIGFCPELLFEQDKRASVMRQATERLWVGATTANVDRHNKGGALLARIKLPATTVLRATKIRWLLEAPGDKMSQRRVLDSKLGHVLKLLRFGEGDHATVPMQCPGDQSVRSPRR